MHAAKPRAFFLLHLPALLLAVGLAGLGYAVQGRLGFGLSDEGFLWYGVQRVMAGEVPIRDFMAYDPGRYYLAAAVLSLFGDDGVLALRMVSTAVQAGGLFIGLVLLGRAAPRRDLVLLIAGAVILAAWMFELYKQYDKTTALALLAALALMAGRPGRRGFFVAGAVIGLAAVIGRNHGLYGALGGVLVLLYLALERGTGGWRCRLPEGTVHWLAGIVAGYTPVLLLALLVPGFAASFVDSLLFLFEYGSTNLTLPVPWPWLYRVSAMPLLDAFRWLVYGSLFILLIVFCLAGAAYLVRAVVGGRSVSPLLVSAICLAPGYTHYAFSRADEYHLAVGIFPLLIGVLVAAAGQRRVVARSVAAVMVLLSVLVTYSLHPVFAECRQQPGSAGCTRLTVGDDELEVRSNIVQMIRAIQNWAAEVPPDRAVLVVPVWPGIYPLLGKTSPVWELYAAAPRSAAFQRREIERLRQARPGMILVNNIGLDNRPDLTYGNTHPLLTRYITENYVEVARMGVYYLFRAPDLVAAPGR